MKRHHLFRLPGAILIFLGFFFAGHETHDAIPHEHPWDTHTAYAASGELYVSDLSPHIGGPARLDADANGGSLVINGTTYAKGVGMFLVHGDYVQVTLPKPAGCTGFAATIGHDNDSEAGTGFRFRVMRLNPSFVEFSNQTIFQGSPPSTIAFPVSDGEIILEGAGSGLGDWGNARFTGCPNVSTPTPPATRDRFVSDLSPQLSGQVRLDVDANGGSLMIGGTTYVKGVGMAVDGNYASATLQKPSGCTRFVATIGHDNNSQGTDFRFRVMRLSPAFEEFANQTISRLSGPATISVAISDGEVILEGAGSGMGDWGSARFIGCPGGGSTPTPLPTQSPTAIPTTPPTQSPTATPTDPPTADGYCPKSLHDSYTTVGPDGKTYPTWHPQRDPSGCYFGHEHGSDPTLFNATWKPAYGYVAIAAQFPEPHEGFKGYALPQFGNYKWYISHHFGTAGAGRVCTRFHEVQWAVTDVRTGQIAAHLAFMGDYGRAENNDDQAHFHPTACPHQADDAIADESYAVRQIATINGTLDYEPWRIDGHKIVNVLGFDPNDLVINTRDGVFICADMICDTLVKNPPRADGVVRMGDDRFVTNNNLGAQFLGTASGTFFTNAFGTAFGGAFRQFVQGGLRAAIPTTGSADETLPHCRYIPDNRMPMVCDSGDTFTNLGQKLKSPN